MTAQADPGPIRSAWSADAWTLERFVADVRAETPRLPPFSADAIDLCRALSERFLRARAYPAVVALGYWLRHSSIAAMRERFCALESADAILVPRGTVLHVTPANVDTMFVYSWILALLAGNANVVRLSSRETETRTWMLQAIAEALADPRFEQLRRRNHLVTFEHDERVLRALSDIADVRVVWGGDETVSRVRAVPMPVRSRDVTFPDRHSMAILDVDAVSAATDEELERLAEGFFNDAYWFDQGACSSPRLVLWSAASNASAESAQAARHRFHSAVTSAIERRGYRAQVGAAINKMAFALQRAASLDGVQIERTSNEATWVLLPDLAGYDRENCGGGLFFEYVSTDLEADLARMVGLKDQTATYFGLSSDTVRGLAGHLNGSGIDRWAPVGHALDFASLWDGYDLLREFTKVVTVTDAVDRAPRR